ncbi:MAG: hypothetical protein ACXW2P_07750, partial [Thermoanaerobaculia bacterium]
GAEGVERWLHGGGDIRPQERQGEREEENGSEAFHERMETGENATFNPRGSRSPKRNSIFLHI